MNGRIGRARVGLRLVLAAALALTLLAGPAAGAQPGARDSGAARVAAGATRVAEGAFDLLVLRPLGVTAVAAGSAFFVASAPFVAPFGGASEAWDAFLYGPIDYTFLRPLGEF